MGTISKVRTTDSSRTPVESTDTRGAPLSAMYHPPKGCAMPLALIDADFRKGGESIVWGYGRGSDEDQRNTPIVQRQYVEARIEALNGKAGKYGGFFCDEDTSGRKIAWIRRPAARILTELLQAGDSIVVHRLDRIGRSLQDVPRLLAWLNLNQIDLYVCDQGGQAIDYAGANSKFMVHVTAAAAQLYSDLNSERIRETFASLKARNLPWYGRPRFGWGRQPVNHRDADGRTRLRWEYYPCERERTEIRWMVDKYGREGWSLNRIWDDLRRRNCLRADGVKKWADRLPCGQRALVPIWSAILYFWAQHAKWGTEAWDDWTIPIRALTTGRGYKHRRASVSDPSLLGASLRSPVEALDVPLLPDLPRSHSGSEAMGE